MKNVLVANLPFLSLFQRDRHQNLASIFEISRMYKRQTKRNTYVMMSYTGSERAGRIVRRIGINEKYFVDFYHRDILFISKEEEEEEKVKHTHTKFAQRNIHLSYQKRKRGKKKKKKLLKSFRLCGLFSLPETRKFSNYSVFEHNRKPNRNS